MITFVSNSLALNSSYEWKKGIRMLLHSLTFRTYQIRKFPRVQHANFLGGFSPRPPWRMANRWLNSVPLTPLKL